jgi:hypothetical protein
VNEAKSRDAIVTVCDCQRLSTGTSGTWVNGTRRVCFPTPAQPKADRQRTTDTTHQLHRSQSDNVSLGSHSRPAQAICPISRHCSISWCPRVQGTYPPIKFSYTAACSPFDVPYIQHMPFNYEGSKAVFGAKVAIFLLTGFSIPGFAAYYQMYVHISAFSVCFGLTASTFSRKAAGGA